MAVMNRPIMSFSPTSLLAILLMWSHLWAFVYAQSTAIPASSTVSSAIASATPNTTITFQSIPTLTTCQTYRIQWAAAGNVDNYNLSIYALGTEGNVTTPSSSASAAAASTSQALASASLALVRKRAAGDKVNQNIATVAADASGYDFFVNLPFGRYYLHGRLDNDQGTGANSQLFWVTEGSDTSCVGVQGASASASGSASARPSSTSAKSSSAVSSAVAEGASNGSGSSGVGGGAIAGIIVGVVGGIAAIAAIWFFCFRRKRRNDVEISGPTMVTRGPGFGSGATLASMAAGATHRSSRHGTGGHIALTSMGSSADSHDKQGASLGSHGSGSGLTPSNQAGNPFATAPNTPMDADTTAFAFSDVPISDYDTPVTAIAGGINPSRRQSQPAPASPSAKDRTRSNSEASEGPSGKVDVKRTVSARRKPVPSLGADLRKQMQRERGAEAQGATRQAGDGGAGIETLKQSYQIMPDPPRAG